MPIQTKPLARKWRDVLTIHPAAELFPRMTPDEFKALVEDIKKNGQRQPIAIIERARRRPDGTFHVSDSPLQEVLDGISRLDAMEAAGIAVTGKDGQLDSRIQRTVVDTDDVDPVAFVISCNIHRRHLTAEQKRDLIAKLLKADPSKSDRQIAETVKAAAQSTGSNPRYIAAVGVLRNTDNASLLTKAATGGMPLLAAAPQARRLAKATAAYKAKLADDLAFTKSTPAERIAAARALGGPEEVWLQMVLPLLEEDRQSAPAE